MGISDEELLEYADNEEVLAWAQATLEKFGDAARYQPSWRCTSRPKPRTWRNFEPAIS